MYYFVVVLFVLLSVMSTVNVACSNQAHLANIWDKRYIYLYTFVYVTKFVLKFNVIKFVFAVTHHSYHLAQGIQFTKGNRLPFESLLYKTFNYSFKRL